MKTPTRFLFSSALALATLLNPSPCFSQGGPPMITDDPGTPPDGHWEINIAAIYTSQPGQATLSVPYADINYGWGDHLQLKFETGLSFLSVTGNSVETGLGDGLAGVKWRFLDQEKCGVSVSTYPQVGFHHLLSSADPLLAEPGTQLLLPLELSREFGGYAINPEVGYLLSSVDPSAVIYGLVLDREPRENLEFLAEIHGTTRINGDGTELFLNAGARVPFSSAVSLLFALGHSVTEFGELPTQLLIYAGTQLRL